MSRVIRSSNFLLSSPCPASSRLGVAAEREPGTVSTSLFTTQLIFCLFVSWGDSVSGVGGRGGWWFDFLLDACAQFDLKPAGEISASRLGGMDSRRRILRLEQIRV